MKIFFARTFAVALVLVLTATGLWAGGGTEDAPATAADKKYVTDPSTGKVVSAPQYGGTLTFAWAIELAHADCYFSHVPCLAVGGVNEKLGIMNWAIDRDEFSFGSTYDPPFTLIPNLAESWDISPDGLTYTFNIRKGVNWHNKPPMNGREFTAEDFVFNWHRYVGLGSGYTEPAAYYASAPPVVLPYESVTATDKYTVVVKLTEPAPKALDTILDGNVFFLYPPEVIKEHGDVRDWRNLVGTGPYMLTDWVEGSSITYNKNPDYWKNDEKYPENRLPYIDELQLFFIKEEATRLAGLRAGRIDLLGFPTDITSVDEVDSLRKTNPEIVLLPWWDRSETSYGIDASKPPFDDINVRKAMQMALDLEGIDRSFYKGAALWQPQGMVGEAISAYHTPFEEWPEEVKKGYMYDPAGAEALLDEAGYPRGADGTRFKTVLNHFYRFDLGYSELAATYWADIGVDVEINVLDEASAPAVRTERTWEGLISHALGNNTEPVGAIRRNAHSTGDDNLHRVGYPELDALVEAAEATTSIEEQTRLVKEIDMYMMENHWWVWGPKTGKYMAHQPWVIGFNGEVWLTVLGRMEVFARLWIDSELKEAMGR